MWWLERCADRPSAGMTHRHVRLVRLALRLRRMPVVTAQRPALIPDDNRNNPPLESR